MAKFRIRIVTPECSAYDEEADSVVVPGADGFFGILAHHAPMIAAVDPGPLRILLDGSESAVFTVGPGVLEVRDDNVLVLTDSAARDGT
jgi:F-type H+-transporting ATPase subunit epsilon